MGEEVDLTYLAYRDKVYRFAEDSTGEPMCHVWRNFSWERVGLEQGAKIVTNPKAQFIPPEDMRSCLQEVFLRRGRG